MEEFIEEFIASLRWESWENKRLSHPLKCGRLPSLVQYLFRAWFTFEYRHYEKKQCSNILSTLLPIVLSDIIWGYYWDDDYGQVYVQAGWNAQVGDHLSFSCNVFQSERIPILWSQFVSGWAGMTHYYQCKPLLMACKPNELPPPQFTNQLAYKKSVSHLSQAGFHLVEVYQATFNGEWEVFAWYWHKEYLGCYKILQPDCDCPYVIVKTVC